MPIATGLALGLGIAGAVGGATIGAVGANKAAGTQARAGLDAAQLQSYDAEQALDFQKQQYADQQRNIQPWLQAGTGAITDLSSLIGPGGDLTKTFGRDFVAPTAATEQNDPGYQFRFQQGQQALENSAAARGGLLTGNMGQALQEYGQNYASNEYGNVYNRALNEYQQAYNIFNQDQNTRYNRLAGIAGVGQTAANQLAQSGQAASNNVSNILLTSGQQQGNAVQNAAAARASGYVGTANAINGGINNAGQAVLLSQLLGNSRSSGNLPIFGNPNAPSSVYY